MKLFVVIAGFVISLPAIAAADYLGKVAAVADGDTFTMESWAEEVRVSESFLVALIRKASFRGGTRLANGSTKSHYGI